MKRLKRGPELKMPKLRLGKSGPGSSSLKLPPVAADVYYDLRERRLLPLLALVLVAILAVPFLLGDADGPVPSPTAVQNAEEAVERELTADRSLTVVQAKPGLRDYRKRLQGRTPTNPFKQKYTSIPGGAQLQSTVETSDTSSVMGGGSSEISITETGGDITEVEVEETGGDGTSPGGSAGNGAGSGGNGAGSGGEVDTDGLRLFAHRPDVRFGVAGSEDLNLYEDLALGSLLPKKKPLLVFIGVSESGERAAFDVSPEVTLVRGNGACIGGRQSCRLLFLREDEAADLLTEEAGRTFRLKVESIDFVEVDVPKQASGSRSASGSRQQRSLGLAQNFSK